jgi:magnesium chelatase subunit D
MTAAGPQSDDDWVAGILAVTGSTCGGVVLSEAATESFVAAYGEAMGMPRPFRQLPATLNPEVFTGSLDLAATMALGSPVKALGLLDTEGVSRLLIRRAEALETAVVSHLANMLDDNRLVLAAVTNPGDEEVGLSPRLADRLAFQLDQEVNSVWTPAIIDEARQRLRSLEVAQEKMIEISQAALALGISSPRSVLHGLEASRVIAALKGKAGVDEEALSIAARLVLVHRATRLPAPEEEQQEELTQQSPNEGQSNQSQSSKSENAEVVLEAVRAAIPQHLLESLAAGLGQRGSGRNIKKGGPSKAKSTRGRRMGSRRSQSLAGQRLDILATLRNAAPWQPLRRGTAGVSRMTVTRDDFQVHRIKQRNESTAIFLVDASGSTAFQRLAEAKGAVEAILSECYVRRDKVALISFRSKSAEELLPPTRSLERAKRALSALPGGGGTPLASALDKGFQLADQVRRADASPIVIVLTDGRANVTREGEGNKAKALEESEAAARAISAHRIQSMVVDVSPEPSRHARELAAQMGAVYFSMPRAQAEDIARPVTAALKSRIG